MPLQPSFGTLYFPNQAWAGSEMKAVGMGPFPLLPKLGRWGAKPEAVSTTTHIFVFSGAGAMSAWPKDGLVAGGDRDAYDEHGPLLGATEVVQPGPELDLRAGSLREEIVR